MATGHLCSDIGAYDNAAELPASIPTYAHYLRSSGYQTALSGKMHFIGPDQHHGFEKRLTPDLYPADFSWVPNWGNEGERDTNDARSVLISGQCERSVQIDFDELVTFNAVQHLNDVARSEDSRPFFLQVSYTHPHEPYLCKPRYWNMYEDKVIPLPAVPALTANQHDVHSRRLLADFSLLDKQFSEEDVLRARRAYCGSVTYLDEMVGQLLDVLDSTGLSENTAVVFTSDHGEMLGERGMWFKKHFYEQSLRVPLFMAIPGSSPRTVKSPVSLLDLLPTFMGIANIKSNRDQPGHWTSDVEVLPGMDLTTLQDHAEDQQRPIYAEYLAEATTAPIFMIRRGRYKCIMSDADPILLFDVENDPEELANLAEIAEHQPLLHAFVDEAKERWDSDSIAAEIKLSQRRRRLILSANKHGETPRWNHDEEPNEDVIWYRGDEGYNQWAFAYLPVNPAKRH